MKSMGPYLTEKINLQAGDTLIMFTDGVTEAMDKNRNEYSDERLEQLATELYKKPAKEILSLIQSSVQEFTKGAVQSDDITVMIIKVL
jgi:phosphoserine phosphatase RsbU/P